MMNINQDYPTSSRTTPYFDSNGGGDGGLKGGLDQRAPHTRKDTVITKAGTKLLLLQHNICDFLDTLGSQHQ
ncbi:hypothetical protein Tco_0318450 [Tanacetum coccineum]